MVLVPDANNSTIHLSPPPCISDDGLDRESSGFVMEKHAQPASAPLSPPSDAESVVVVEKETVAPEYHRGESLVLNSPEITLHLKEIKLCRTIIISAQRHEAAWPFKQPVDPIAYGAFNYFDIIKKPMDISTISKRLSNSQYPTVQAFAADFRLMLDNCYLYNPALHAVHVAGRALDTHLANQFAKHFPELNPNISTCMTTSHNGTPTKRTTRRNIRPPKVYEPEEIPTRKRSMDFDDVEQNKKKLHSMLSKLQSSGNIDPEIQSIMSEIKVLTDKIDSISQKNGGSESYAKPRSGASTSSSSRKKVAKACTQCYTRESPAWRTGPAGRATLCQKCGDKYQSMKKSKKPLTYDEQVYLSENFGTLPVEKQRTCMEIISGGVQIEGKELEIDLQALDPKTARQLYEFVAMAAEGSRGGEESDSDDSDSSGSDSD